MTRTLMTLNKATVEERVQLEITSGALKNASKDTQEAALATARLLDAKRAEIAMEKEQAAALAASTAAIAKQRAARDQDVNVIASRGRQLGSTATAYVTAPILGVDAAALAVGTKYEALLAKIQGLAGASANEIALMREQILALGPAIGRGPNELAEAMFHIYSEGYKGAQAMDVLARAGKMAEIGMGDTKANAQALVFTMHDMGVSAKDAADILVAAVRLGNVATETLTANLGKVLPTAGLLGVQMRDVAAMFAVLTRSGLDAAMAATGIRQVFVTLLDTTPKTQKALKALHLSAYELREEMKTDLLGALQKISAAADGNATAFSKVFPNVRALTAALGTLSQNGGDARDIFDQVAHSSGGLEKAFGIQANTIQHKFNVALAELEVAGQKLTTALTPALTSLVEHVTALVQAFNELSPATQSLAVVAGLGLAALGPMTTVVASLASGSRFLISALKVLGFEATAVGAAGVTAAGGIEAAGTAAAVAEIPVAGIVAGLGLFTVAAAAAYVALSDGTSKTIQNAKESKRLADQHVENAQRAADLTVEAKRLSDQIHELEMKGKDATSQHRKLQEIMNAISTLSPDLVLGYKDQGDAIDLVGQYAGKAAQQLNDYKKAAQDAALAVSSLTRNKIDNDIADQKRRMADPRFQSKYLEENLPWGSLSKETLSQTKYQYQAQQQAILRTLETQKADAIQAWEAAMHGGKAEGPDNPFPYVPAKGGGGLHNAPDQGGGGGKTKAAKQSDEEKALDRLREKNQELAMSIALVGNESEETRQKMELAYGEYAKTGDQARFTAAMEARFADAQNKIAQQMFGKNYSALGTKGSKEESANQVRVNSVVLASKFQEITQYSEKFKENSKLIDDYWNELYKSVKDFNDKGLKEGADFLKEQLKTYQEIISPAKELTNVQKAQLAIAEAQPSGKMMNPMDAQSILFKAGEADNALAVRKHIADVDKEIAQSEKEIEASFWSQFDALQKIADKDKRMASSVESMQIELLKAQGKWTPADQARESLGLGRSTTLTSHQQQAVSIATQIQQAITKTKEWTDLQNTLSNDLSSAIVKGLTQGRGKARNVLAGMIADVNDSVKKIGEAFLQKELEGVFQKAIGKLMPNFGAGIPGLGQDTALVNNTNALVNVYYGLEDLTYQLQASGGGIGQSSAGGGGGGWLGSLGPIIGGLLGGKGGGAGKGEGSSGAAGQSTPSSIPNAIISPTSRSTSVGATQAIHNQLSVSTGFVIKTSDPYTTVGIAPRITNTQQAARAVRARR